MGDFTPIRKKIFDLGEHFIGSGIIYLDEFSLQRLQVTDAFSGLGFRLPGSSGLGLFSFQFLGSGNPDNIALVNHSQIFLNKDQIQGLIPWNIFQAQGNSPGYVFVQNQVIISDGSNKTDYVFDFGILKINGNEIPGIILLHAGKKSTGSDLCGCAGKLPGQVCKMDVSTAVLLSF